MTIAQREMAVPASRNGKAGAAVRIDTLYKRYGTVVAIDGIDLAISSGEFLTLLGPSGSGKTTTLMTIAGFEVPTSGDIFIDDREVSRIPPHRRDIGMVFQSYALFPHMTIAENIAFPLQMRKMSKAERETKVRDALRMVRLPGVEGRYPQQLSGGQQQRIALARALVYDPPLLLMDEPLGALDKKLREELQLEIKRLQNRLHITVIYVTHDQSEALVMSDRIAVFNNGRIEQIGTPEDLYDRPANRFVASFLGESNFLEATVADCTGNTCVAYTEGARFRVRTDSDVHAGDRVIMAIRPEKLLLSLDGDLPNAQQVTVQDVIFEGEVRRYELRLPAGNILVLKQTNRQGIQHLEVGARAIVGWDDADARIVEVNR
jgi:spermidine/putrescine ABC transporter ATP-binding subunit